MVLAKQTQVGTILGTNHQLRAPLYQRRYEWKRPQWDALWDDIARLAEQRKVNENDHHFLGSFVLAKTPTSSATGQVIVDGQQRLITLTLLLCALRDSQEPSLPTSVRHRVDKRLTFTSPDGKQLGPLKRLKVVPTQLDRDAFVRIVDRQSLSDGGHRVVHAYRHYTKLVQRLAADEDGSAVGVSITEMAGAILDGLECVRITAEPEDNVHRIFESLNNTGTDLTQADLLRNYVFMRLDQGSEDFYQYMWKPLEERFDTDELTQLFWLDLVRQHPTINQRSTYVEQQKRLEKLTTRKQLAGAIESIAAQGELFTLVLHPEKETSSKRVRLHLQRLKDWQTTTVQPMLMYLLKLREDGEATSPQIAKAMQYLESFYVRRVLVGLATMNINRVILGAPNALTADPRPVDIALRDYLSGSGKYWSTDDELRRDVVLKRFYNHGKAHQKTLILKWIEEGLGDMEVEFAEDLTIEHVMPQTLTPLWREELKPAATQEGRSVAELHETYLHTLGNITLIRRHSNSRMKNKSFAEKKKILADWGSNLQLTREITRLHIWSPTKIENRSKLMVERIIHNWPGPLPPRTDA